MPIWMMCLALDMVSACASVLATTKSTPCRPTAIMLLTALPPAPPTPNTVMRAFISRMSVMLVMFVTIASSKLRMRGLLPTSLAVCFNYGRGEMSQSACSLSLAVDRAASSATGPQSRQLAFKPCRCFLGRHSVGSRLEQLHHQAIGALALAFKVCPVARRPYFEPRDLRLQCLDLYLQQSDVACLVSTWSPGSVPNLSEINAHQGFAVRRQQARQPESLGKRASGLWRDFEAGT